MDLVGDDRAQSIQIGAVLLFAVLIISFSTYQAFIVPDQNREVEANHNQQAQRDMVNVRNTLLDTYTGGTDGYAEVTLGTEYPARLIALNPPSPSGSLYTTESQSIVIEDDTGDITSDVCPDPSGDGIQTRSLEYAPSYSEYTNGGTLRYENSFVVQEFRDGTVTRTGQTLVRNDTLQIIPLNRSYNAGGSQTVSIEFRPGLVDTTETYVDTVTLLTRTDQETWETLLAGEDAVDNIAVDEGAGTVTLTLDQTVTIECGPVGVGESPDSGDRSNNEGEINPADAGDIRFEAESLQTGTSSDILLSLNNTANRSTNITEARINFYQSTESGNNVPTRAILRNPSGTGVATLDFGDSLTTLSSNIELPSRTVTDIELDFENDKTTDPNLNSDSWFVFTISLETGEQATYFVSIP